MEAILEDEPVVLWHEYRKSGDVALRNGLVLRNMGLVYRIAGRYAPLAQDAVDDMVQEGCLGLIRAVERFQPDYGVQFSTYAYHVISGSIKNYLRARRRLLAYSSASREQPDEELSTSVERPIGRGETLVSPESLDAVPEALVQDFSDAVVDRVVTTDLLDRLPPLERRIVHHLFYEDLTQREIATAVARSTSRVSRLMRSALDRVRTLFLSLEEEEARLTGRVSPPGRLVVPSLVDPETRLFSSRHLTRCLQREINRARALNAPLSLALIRPNRPAGTVDPGDLSKIATAMYQRIRVLDHVFRAGPEELAVIFSLPADIVVGICRRLHSADSPVELSCSVSSYPKDADSCSGLLEAARQGLPAAQ
jgi:RNA polymerase sigma factor (sigma-70 family)